MSSKEVISSATQMVLTDTSGAGGRGGVFAGKMSLHMFSVFAFFFLASFIPQPQPASAVWRMPKECSSSHSSWSSWGVQTHSKIDHFPHFLKLYEWVYDDKVSFLFTVRRYLSLGQSSDKCHLKEKSSLKVEKGKCNHPRVIEFTRGNILKLLHFFFFFLRIKNMEWGWNVDMALKATDYIKTNVIVYMTLHQKEMYLK